MARKTISQRIALEGGDAIKKQLSEFGQTGERAFKEVQAAADKMKGPGAEFARGMDNALKKVRELGEGIKNVGQGMRNFGAGLSVGLTAPLLAIGAKGIAAWKVQEEAIARVEAAIRSTGGAAGVTSEELQAMASEFQKITLYGDEATLQMQALLLTFTNIRGADTFKATTAAVLDLAAGMRMDLQSAAVMVGKAMNDPVRGVNAMTRAGVQFSPVQKELINELMRTGQVAEAQAIILKELGVQYGGMAEQLAQTGFGPYEQALMRLGDAWEEVGKAMAPVLTKIADGINALAQLITVAVAKFVELPERAQNAILILGGLAVVLGPLLAIVGQMVIGIGGLMLLFGGMGGVLAPIAGALAGVSAAFGSLGAIVAGVAAVLMSWPALFILLGASLGALAGAIYNNWDQIEAHLTGVFSRLDAKADGWVASMREAAQGVSAQIGAAVSDAAASLDEQADALVASLREKVQSGLASIGEAVSSIFTSIAEMAAAAWATLPEGLQSAGDAIMSVFSRIGDAIAAQFQKLDDMASRLVDSLKAKVQALLSAIGLANASAGGGTGASGYAAGGSVPGFASGGPVRGPGTSTSDSILSKVDVGEFIVRARAVRHYGPQLFDKLNRLRAPLGDGARPAARGRPPARTILARLSNGEYRIQPAAVRYYGVALFELLNRLKLPKGSAMSGFAAGGSVAWKRRPVGVALPRAARLTAAPTEMSGSRTPREQVGRAPASLRLSIPAFADGGIVSNAVSSVRNHGARISNVLNRLSSSVAAPGPGKFNPTATIELSGVKGSKSPAAVGAIAPAVRKRILEAVNGVRNVRLPQTVAGGPVSITAAPVGERASGGPHFSGQELTWGIGGPVSSVSSSVRSYGARLSQVLNRLAAAEAPGLSITASGPVAAARHLSERTAEIIKTLRLPGAVSVPGTPGASAPAPAVNLRSAPSIRNYTSQLSRVLNQVGGDRVSFSHRSGGQANRAAAVLVPALASGGIVPGDPSVRVSVAAGLRELRDRVLTLAVPGFSVGGSADHSIRTFSRVAKAYRSQVSNVANRLSAIFVPEGASVTANLAPLWGQPSPPLKITSPPFGANLAPHYGEPRHPSERTPPTLRANPVRPYGQPRSHFVGTSPTLRENLASLMTWVPAFAAGGPVSSRTVQNFGRAIANHRTQIANQVLPAFASGGSVMGRLSAAVMIPALAAGGLTPTMPGVATAQAPAAPYASLNLTIGGETFSGLMAPRDTAESLMRYAEGEKIRRAGSKPGWVK